MIRIGIVGMGGMGWFHASRYFQIPGVQIAAIADCRPERLEAQHAVQINIENKMSTPDLSEVERFSEGMALIAQADVDVIDICLPSYLHAAYAIAALKAGRHVLCEKPMALKVEDANGMIAAAHAANRKLMIAQCIRFWPEYQFLKQTVQNGTLGRLMALNLVRMGGSPIGWGWEDWFLDPARSGGTLYDLHIHDVDFVNSVFGTPQRLAAFGRRASPASACEVIQTVFSYTHGPQISIQAGWSEVQIPFKASYEAWFENGFVRFDPGANPCLLVYDHASRQNAQPAVYTPGDAYLNELQYFIGCIQNNQDLAECPPESARDSLALLSRIRDAILQEEQK